MSDEKGTIIESGWKVAVRANPAVKPFSGSQQLTTAYLLLKVVKAAFFKGTMDIGDGIDLHVLVERTQAKNPKGEEIPDCKGMEIRLDRLWLSWSAQYRDAAVARMAASGKMGADDINKALLREERTFKSLLVALGYPSEGVVGLDQELEPGLFLNSPTGGQLVAWHERGIWSAAENKFERRPIWTYLPPDRKAVLDGAAWPELYNEEYRTGAKATTTVQPGGATASPQIGVGTTQPLGATQPLGLRPNPVLGVGASPNNGLQPAAAVSPLALSAQQPRA